MIKIVLLIYTAAFSVRGGIQKVEQTNCQLLICVVFLVLCLNKSSSVLHTNMFKKMKEKNRRKIFSYFAHSVFDISQNVTLGLDRLSIDFSSVIDLYNVYIIIISTIIFI